MGVSCSCSCPGQVIEYIDILNIESKVEEDDEFDSRSRNQKKSPWVKRQNPLPIAPLPRGSSDITLEIRIIRKKTIAERKTKQRSNSHDTDKLKRKKLQMKDSGANVQPIRMPSRAVIYCENETRKERADNFNARVEDLEARRQSVMHSRHVKRNSFSSSLSSVSSESEISIVKPICQPDLATLPNQVDAEA